MSQLSYSQASEIVSKKLPEKIALFPLAIRQEKDQFIVGIAETGKFVILPEVGIKTIKYLQEGDELRVIQTKIQMEFGKVDLKKFLISLINLGFVSKIDDLEIKSEFNSKITFSWIKAKYVAWIFSKPMYFIYLLIILVTGFTLVKKPWLIPSYYDFFWTDKTSIVIVTNLIISSFFVFLHELSHLIAARSRGIPSKFGLGTRLHLLVAKTDVSGVWSLPKRQRFRVYLAGMGCNIMIICLTLLLLAYSPAAGVMRSLLKVIVLINFLSLIPQFYLHLRMDLYYLLLNLLNCYNLFNDSKSYLKFIATRFLKKLQHKTFDTPDPLSELPHPEQKKVRIYAWFMGTGVMLSLYIYVFYTLPILLISYWRGFDSIRGGINKSDILLFADGAATILIRTSFLGVFILVLIKNNQKNLAKVGRLKIFSFLQRVDTKS